LSDRHARHRRRDADPRRRPVDGFRALRPERFERLVVAAIESLPEDLLAYLDNVQILIDDIPPADVPGIGEQVLLGLYEGVPKTMRGNDAPLLPDRITLYRRSLEVRARSMAELSAIVQETVVHEIAHHYGIDDDRLNGLGWG
jgi:predicted Zn-dependent protease with MMP-like domain